MSPAGLSFELIALGDVHIEREFLRWGERAMEARALWDVLHQALMDMEYEQFNSQGAHGSGGWAPLKPATVREKERQGYPADILRRTDVLFKSLTQPDAEGAVFENFGSYMRWGSDISYGILHQRGTVKMPARKPIQFTEAERIAIVKTVQRFIATGEVLDPRLSEIY